MAATFTVRGIGISSSQIMDLTVELDNAGGPQSATIVVAADMMHAPEIFAPVELGGMKFRVENVAADVGSTAGYTITCGPAMAKLRDHKGYRCTFVDSDLQNIKTDQGPRSSPDTFEVTSKSSAAS